MVVVYGVIFFLTILVVYNFTREIYLWSSSNIENFDNPDCTDKMSSMIYKNNGAIQNLQESVDKLTTQLNELILTNDKQETEISNLSTLQNKFDKLAQKADEIANNNKQQLIELAKEAHQRANQAQQEANQLPSP